MNGPLTLDHLAIRVRDIEQTVAFYERVLGAEVLNLEAYRAGRHPHAALRWGKQRINLHPDHAGPRPPGYIAATNPTAGGADLCFVWPGPIAQAAAHLAAQGVEVEVGPGARPGAQGTGISLYFRDPDGNLLEFMSYTDPAL